MAYKSVARTISAILLVGIALIVFSSFISATIDNQTRSQAEQIINNKISCSNLTDNQLEVLGDYYMEQMHPGQAHEIMEQRLGGEDSEQVRQTHIAMAKMFYCGNTGAMSDAMRSQVLQGSGGMMGGMMNWAWGSNQYGSGPFVLTWIIMILVILLIIAAIYWLIKTANRK